MSLLMFHSFFLVSYVIIGDFNVNVHNSSGFVS